MQEKKETAKAPKNGERSRPWCKKSFKIDYFVAEQSFQISI